MLLGFAHKDSESELMKVQVASPTTRSEQVVVLPVRPSFLAGLQDRQDNGRLDRIGG
jgi:hypothetical protein